MARKGGVGAYMGHEKEPPKNHPGPRGGRAPLVHSHSAKPKRKIMPKRGMHKAM